MCPYHSNLPWEEEEVEEYEEEEEQARAELCQAQFKLRLAKPDLPLND